MKTLEQLANLYLPSIEERMKEVIFQASRPEVKDLHEILAYHMGWIGPGAGPEARGKRIRPLLVLLCASACDGQWEKALPAAGAVELLHNFSLIHDDIEDNSPLRRGRETVWKIWGIPLAINAGDAMFTLANLSILDLEDSNIALQAARILLATSLHLTQGQHLDISYENRPNLTQEDYWPMIHGKTAALLSACTGLGALTGGAPRDKQEEFILFGKYLGLAFQAQDDLLGIWGEAELTGKSAESDLVSGKKSLPVLYGLSLAGPFARRWQQGKISPVEVPELAAQLEKEGARDFTKDKVASLTVEALSALERTGSQGEAGEALDQLAHQLLNRRA